MGALPPSCVSEPDAVGVGSSGSIMGVLGAWAVFILYTWCDYCYQCVSVADTMGGGGPGVIPCTSLGSIV